MLEKNEKLRMSSSEAQSGKSEDLVWLCIVQLREILYKHAIITRNSHVVKASGFESCVLDK